MQESKEKLNIRIYNRETEIMPPVPEDCLEICCYDNEIAAWYLGKLIAEIHDDGNFIDIYEELRNKLGIFYYDFIKAMEGLGVDI